MDPLRQRLADREARHLYRRRRKVEASAGVEVTLDGRTLLAFCSNDYLGLRDHPDLVDALRAGADRWGVGAGSAHLVAGHTSAHQALEEELADFLGRPRALLFSTGYMANLGVVSALAPRGVVVEDRLNHASLLDGARLAGARLLRYRHASVEAAAERLGGRSGALLVTDGLFSMEGDLAPLPGLAALAREHEATLMVDDAHGIGVLGDQGRGTLELQGVEREVPVLVGTFGKAFGGFGAFVAGDEVLVETLIQEARSYVYTTAPPPALAEAMRAALRRVREDHWRRERLREHVRRFRRGVAALGLELLDAETPVQALILGEPERALRWSRWLEEAGLLVGAIRPPTVPEGSARLRITFSAAHTAGQVDCLLQALAACRDREEEAG